MARNASRCSFTKSLFSSFGTITFLQCTSRITASVQVKGYTGPDELAGALEGADVVLIPAGVPRKPGMTRQDLFNINAGIVKSICESIAKHCPNVSIFNRASTHVNTCHVNDLLNLNSSCRLCPDSEAPTQVRSTECIPFFS